MPREFGTQLGTQLGTTMGTRIALVATALTLTGCNGAFWGNLAVLGITVGIFFATLALGRTSAASRSGAEASSSTQSGHGSGRR